MSLSMSDVYETDSGSLLPHAFLPVGTPRACLADNSGRRNPYGWMTGGGVRRETYGTDGTNTRPTSGLGGIDEDELGTRQRTIS